MSDEPDQDLARPTAEADGDTADGGDTAEAGGATAEADGDTAEADGDTAEADGDTAEADGTEPAAPVAEPAPAAGEATDADMEKPATAPDTPAAVAPCEPADTPGAVGEPASPAGAPELGAPGAVTEPASPAGIAEPPVAERATGPTGPGEAVSEPVPEPAARHEQIEWQPVATGDHVEWQPVVSEGAGSGAWPEPSSYEGHDDEDAGIGASGWDPDPGPVAGANGSAARTASGRGAHPAQRRPPAGRRPPAKRRQPQAAARPTRRRYSGDTDRDPDDKPDAVASKAKRQVILLSIATVAVVAVAGIAFMLSRDAKQAGSEATGGGTPTTLRTVQTIPADQMQQVRDPLTNFVIKVPKAWENFQTPVADIRLVMGAGENDGLRIRVIPIQTPATVDNITNFKEVTDAIVFGDQTAKLIQQQLIRVNSLLAYHYIYTFKDKATGLEGVHAHYFVFEGNRMFSIVFQTLPTEDFPRLAPVFDQVAESFTVGAAPAPTTTTP